MKKLILLLLILSAIKVSAQMYTIPFPSGYTASELGPKNCLRVSPDDHIWVAFSHIGVGEYDGVSWRFYNDTTGLTGNYASCLAFGGNKKWFGTNHGLIETDGVNLISFTMLNSPMPSNNIISLFQSDTTLWIGTDSGAVSFDGVHFNIHNTSNSPLTSNRILSINENNFGLYFSTPNEIKVLTSSGWKNTSPTIPVTYRLTADKNGNVYANNYQVHDTIFNKITIPSNPCYYNNLHVQPYNFLGATANDNYFFSGPADHPDILDLDATMIEKNTYPINQLLGNSLYEDTFDLYDITSNGVLISTNNNSPIFVTDFTGLQHILKTDSCPYLDVNMVNARVWNNGSMFWDTMGSSLYEVPRGTGLSPIFSEGLWIGGKDAADHLHIAAQTYRQSGSDFWPGPLDTLNALIDPQTSVDYDKIWKIDLFTINDFKFNFQNGNVANGTYTIPDIILNWPAHGSGNYAHNLAPFVDFNLDGIYNPLDGDYPKIKGDQMLWWVFNDNKSFHGETESQYNLGVEIHGSAYAYSCPQLNNSDSVLNYTTFYHYDFINRSDTDYHDVYTGINTDVDLGNYLDDYVGCDTSLDIAYAINGDDDDNFVLDNRQWGYGSHPPMINLALLKGPQPLPNDGLDNNHNGTIDESGETCMMNYFVYSNNDFTALGNPSFAQDYYNRMQGIWRDGVPLTYGGIGHDTSSTNYTHYMFSGQPYDLTSGWSELHPCNGCQSNTPSDRRLNVSSGPFNLPAHEQRSLDYAYVYTREPNFPNGATTSYAVNIDQVMRIKHFFETDSFPCLHLIGIDEISNDLSIDLFPNPAHSEITVSMTKADAGIKSYNITDIAGEEIMKPVKTFASSFKIDLHRMAAGVYFLHVISGNGSCVRKFIVE